MIFRGKGGRRDNSPKSPLCLWLYNHMSWVLIRKLRMKNPWQCKVRQKKILIRHCECAGWSESSLGPHVRRYVFWCRGSIWFYLAIFHSHSLLEISCVTRHRKGNGRTFRHFDKGDNLINCYYISSDMCANWRLKSACAWHQSSLSVWRNVAPFALYLIWIFAEHICPKVRFLTFWSLLLVDSCSLVESNKSHHKSRTLTTLMVFDSEHPYKSNMRSWYPSDTARKYWTDYARADGTFNMVYSIERDHIAKTCLFKYIENFITKIWKFSDKNSDIFYISA